MTRELAETPGAEPAEVDAFLGDHQSDETRLEDFEAEFGDDADGLDPQTGLQIDDSVRLSLQTLASERGLDPSHLNGLEDIKRADPGLHVALTTAFGTNARRQLSALHAAILRMDPSVVAAAERAGMHRDPDLLRMLAERETGRHRPGGAKASRQSTQGAASMPANNSGNSQLKNKHHEAITKSMDAQRRGDHYEAERWTKVGDAIAAKLWPNYVED